MESTDTNGRTAQSFAEITGIRPTFEQWAIGQLYFQGFAPFRSLGSYAPSLPQEEIMDRLNTLVCEGRISIKPFCADSASEPAYALSHSERTRMDTIIAEICDTQSGF